MKLQGTLTALVTPMHDDAERGVDWAALERLLETQLQGGVDGLVPCGTTGESPTLSEAEQEQLLRICVQHAQGRVPVVMGVGSNCTAHTIERAQRAERLGADAVMVVAPYYNKPSQAGMIEHFAAVAAKVSLPVVLYNIPGRCVVDFTADSLARLLERAPNVVAIKEASGQLVRAQEQLVRFGDRLQVLSGDDALTLPMMACGARGVISVTSNVLPKACREVTARALAGDFAGARAAHLALLSLHQAMFVEPNPAPIKAALALRGITQAAVRAPMLPAGEATRAQLAPLLARFA